MRYRAGHLTCAALVLLALCLFPVCLTAQVTTATLFGNVTDSSGAVVPQATVIMTNLGTNISTTVTTNGAGEYRFDLVPVGTYSVTVSAKGFKKFVQTNVPLVVNQEQRVDVTLTVGAAEQTVSVSSAPPQIDLAAATQAVTLETRQIENLPIVNNSRSVYGLFTLIPGVQNATAGNTLGYNQEVVQMSGSTTGLNTGNVSYYLDGGLNMTALRNTGNDMPTPEALAEFNVQTTDYNATYGRMSAGVVSAITKSGSNQFHGEAYEFNRNTDFNAGNPAVLGGGNPPYHLNVFGGTIGGPIVRNKTFFFGEYGQVRRETPSSVFGATLPTFSGGTTGKGEAGGDFSAFLPAGALATAACGGTATAFVVCSPTTRKPYTTDGVHASNIITDPLDPTSVNIMAYIKPFENGVNTAGLPTWAGTIAQPYDTWEALGKIDHQITDRQRLEGSYFYLNGTRTIPAGGSSVPWVLQVQDWTQQVMDLGHTFTINDHEINQAVFSFTRLLGGRANTNNANKPGRESLAAFGSNYAIQGPASLSSISVSGYFTLSNAIDGPKAGTDFYSLRDLFTWNLGKHAITFGGEASLNKDDQLTDLDNWGSLGFTSSTSARTGNALSDFVTGYLNNEEQDAPVDAIDNSFYYAGFVQDDWRVLSNLTLNLGVRWDLETPPTDPQNKESTFVAGQKSLVNPNMPLGELVVGDPGITRGTVKTPYEHYGPRLGFAWDPFKNGKTSIRGAAGIFWGEPSGNEWNATSNYYPFSLRYTFPYQGTLTYPYGVPGVTGSAAGAGLIGNGITSPFPYVYTPGQVGAIVTGGSIEGVTPGFVWPRTYQLTASIQRQITNSLAAAVFYVGSLGRHIGFQSDPNDPVFNTASPASNTQKNELTRRPIDSGVLGEILAAGPTQTSNYNAFQFTFSQRVAHGVSFQGFYTFSKNIDSGQLNSTTAPEDFSIQKIDKGPGDQDQRHVFVASVVWQSDYVHGNRILAAVANGWQASAIVNLHSGLPFNVTTGSDNNLDSYTSDRPNLLATGQIYNTGNNRSSRSALIKEYYINNAFATPAAGATALPTGTVFCGYNPANPTPCSGHGGAGQDGDMQRNMLYGPGYRDVDAAISRDFPIGSERVKFQLRGEASNIFNLVSLGNPNGTLNSATAGAISGIQGNMREIQVGGKLTF